MERLVELVQRRALERSERFVGTTQEVLVEGPSRTDPAQAARAHAPQQDGQLHRARAAGRAGRRSRSPARPRRRSPARSRSSPVPPDVCRDLRPHRGRQDGGRGRAGRRCCATRRDPVAVSADAIQVYEGLDVLAAKPADATGSSTGWSRSSRSTRSSAPAATRSWRTPEIDGAGRAGTRCRSSSAAPGLYLRAALTDLDLRPPPEPDLRARLERELAEVGAGIAARPPVRPPRRRRCTRTIASGSCGRWSWS